MSAQKLLALKAILLGGSSQQVASVPAYMRQLQRLHQAASQVRSAQEHQTAAVQLKQLMLQQQHQQLQQQQQQCSARQGHHDMQQRHSAALSSEQQRQQQFLEALMLQQQYSSEHNCMHDVQTPVQPLELLSSTAEHCQPAYNAYPSQHGSGPHTSVQLRFECQQAQHAQHSAQDQYCHAEVTWQTAQNALQCQHPHSKQVVATSLQKLLHMHQQAQLQHLAKLSQGRLQQQLAQGQVDRQLVTAPCCRPSSGFPDLVAYWAKGLNLQRCESVHLACHLWTRVQQQVSIAYMHLVGAERPWETMLIGCLWLAAKLEECRRGVPTASKVGAIVGVDRAVMGGVELYLMQLVNWAPMSNWKDRPLHEEDASWY